MSNDTTASRAPDLADQLWAFNEERRQILGRPASPGAAGISPEGESILGRLLSDPPEEDGSYARLDR